MSPHPPVPVQPQKPQSRQPVQPSLPQKQQQQQPNTKQQQSQSKQSSTGTGINAVDVVCDNDNDDDYIIVRPYEWVGKDYEFKSQTRIWTLTRSDNSEDGISRQVCLRVEDFTPTLRVELPTVIDGQIIDWTNERIAGLAPIFDTLSPTVKPIKKTVDTKNRIYFYVPVKVVTLHFKSERDMWSYKKLIEAPICLDKNRGKYIEFKVWESNITTVHKLSTQRDIGYTQWIKVKKSDCRLVDYESQITLACEEYVVPFESLFGLDEELTASWQVNPMTLTLDIECYTPNFNTMPKGIYIDNVVTMNSLIFQLMFPDRTGSKRQVKILQTIDPCDDIPGAEVRYYDHEINMILGMQEFIRKYNPYIIYTFNGFKFDFPYLDERLDNLGLKWNNLSCMQDEYSDTKIDDRSWHSSAQQTVIIKNLEMEGRLSLDIYRIMRADYPTLAQHSLQFLSEVFLEKGKHPISAQEMFKIHELSVNAHKSGNVEQIRKARTEVARVGSYCLQDSLLTYELPEKLNIFTALMEMSNIVCVTPSSIYTRGQQIRVRNQIYKEVYHEGYILNDLGVKVTKYGGGYVCPPIVGRHSAVMIFDFASLYPSIIRAYNICYTTLVNDDNVPDTNCNIIEWYEDAIDEEDKKPKKRGKKNQQANVEVKEPLPKIHFRYRFLKKEVRPGVLPRICEKLVTKRKVVRELMEDPNITPFMYSVYNQRQLAIKVCANSVYGFLGAQVMPLQEAAASVTAKGRELNFVCQDYVKKYKGLVVYGDTDSIMVSLPFINTEETYHWGEKLANELTELFPTPLKLEFERAFHVVIYVTKKRYAGIETKYYNLKHVSNRRVRKFDVGYLHTFSYLDVKKNETKECHVLSDLEHFKEFIAGMLVDETKHFAVSNITDHQVQPISFTTSITNDGSSSDNSNVTRDSYLHTFTYRDDKKQTTKNYCILSECESSNDVVVNDKKKQVTINSIGGFSVNSKGEIDLDLKKIKHKGLANTRRDRCKWAQNCFSEILKSALFNKNLEFILDQIDKYVFDMMYGLVQIKDLMLTREVNNYKDTARCPMKLFKIEQEKRGYPLELGERVVYVFVTRPTVEGNSKQGFKMCLLNDYIKNKHQEPIDRIFYVEKQLCKPIEQLLEIVYGAELSTLNSDLGDFGYKPRYFVNTRLGVKYITMWTKMINWKNKVCQELLYTHYNNLITTTSTNASTFDDSNKIINAVHNDDYWSYVGNYWNRMALFEEWDENFTEIMESPYTPHLDKLLHPSCKVDYRKFLNKLVRVQQMTETPVTVVNNTYVASTSSSSSSS